jgi:hypothetical protein
MANMTVVHSAAKKAGQRAAATVPQRAVGWAEPWDERTAARLVWQTAESKADLTVENWEHHLAGAWAASLVDRKVAQMVVRSVAELVQMWVA